MSSTMMRKEQTNNELMPFPSPSMIEDACEWAIMHGVAFRQADNTARHCPFSLAPMTMEREVYQHLRRVTPLITKLISGVSEDHDFLQATLGNMANADPFFGRLMQLHQQAHGTSDARLTPARQPLLLMRTDFMDDRQHGAKVIEFNGIAAGWGRLVSVRRSFMLTCKSSGRRYTKTGWKITTPPLPTTKG